MKKNIGLFCNVVPNLSTGASSSIYYLYINQLLDSDYVIDLFIFTKSKTVDNEYVKLLKKNISNVSLNVILIEKDIQYSFFPWKKSFIFYQLFKKNIFLNQEFDKIVCFDIASGFECRNLKAKFKSLWLGDLTYEIEYHTFLEKLKYNKKEIVKIFPMLYFFIIKASPYFFCRFKFEKIICASLSSKSRLTNIGLKAVFYPFPYQNNTTFSKEFVSDKTFLFYGNLTGTGSTSGLKLLFEDILPKAQKKWGIGGCKILIGGRTPIDSQTKLFLDKFPEVHYIGFIEDLEEVFSKVNSLLIPIPIKVGNRTRVIDGLSYGIPIIGHENLQLGNPYLIDGVNCLLSNNGDDFIENMNIITKDKDLYFKLINNGKQTFKLTYDPINKQSNFLIKK